ncbi:hypothetical protein NDU88_004284 [Pleurodeles waltl]|uniref:Uncharacterized protein n=1 Tax=Pleurodeles waltl TaxID=8319 RepID=A0AAV7SIH2_PLEWA|nr:hypothetical protein NDU88_004284 [Pleurodeles waltl]
MQRWEAAEVDTEGAFFHDKVLKPFDHLHSEEGIQRRHFIAHARLTVLLTKQWRILDLEPARHLLVHVIHVIGSGKKLITLLNRALANTTTDPLQLLRRRWEQDVGRELQDKEWDRVLNYHNKISRNACFWQQILGVITKLTQRLELYKAEGVLLGLFHLSKQAAVTYCFIDLALIIGRSAIDMGWKSPTLPKLSHWGAALIKRSKVEETALRQKESRGVRRVPIASGWGMYVHELQEYCEQLVP